MISYWLILVSPMRSSIVVPIELLLSTTLVCTKNHFNCEFDSNEKQWIISLTKESRISIVLGVGKHNLSGAARIIQKALHDLLQNNIFYPNLYWKMNTISNCWCHFTFPVSRKSLQYENFHLQEEQTLQANSSIGLTLNFNWHYLPNHFLELGLNWMVPY